MVVNKTKNLSFLLVKDKYYIKTSLQLFVLTPRYREVKYYRTTMEDLSTCKLQSILDVIHLCNNKIDITAINHGHTDSNFSNL